MAGAIFRALQKTGFLKPIADNLNELVKRKQYEQGLQQLAQMLSGGEKNITDIYGAKKTVAGDANFQETPVDEYGSNPVPDNTPLKQLVGGINPKDRGSALNKGGTDSFLLGDYNKRAPEGSFYETQFKIIPRYKDEPLIEQSRVLRREIPKTGAIPPRNSLKTLAGDQGVGQNVDRGTEQGTFKPYDEKTVSKYTPEEQNQLAQREIFNVVKELITNKNIDPTKGSQVVSALQQLITSQQPKKKKLQGINTTDDVYDEYGNLVKQGVPKTTKESIPNRYERVETFDVKGKPVKRGLVKGTNTWEDLGEAYYQPQKGTTVNVNTNPDTSTDYGKVYAIASEIDAFKNNVSYNPKTGLYSMRNNKGEDVDLTHDQYRMMIDAKKGRGQEFGRKMVRQGGNWSHYEAITEKIEKQLDENIKQTKDETPEKFQMRRNNARKKIYRQVLDNYIRDNNNTKGAEQLDENDKSDIDALLYLDTQ